MPSDGTLSNFLQRMRRGSNHRGLITVAILVAILAILGFSAKPAYRAFRKHRLEKNLEAATVAVRLEDWTKARDLARSVLLVQKDNFEAFRIWSRALAELGDPSAYLAAIRRFVGPHATDEDRLEALRVLVAQAPQAIALGAIASLSETDRLRADYVAAITPLLILRGHAEVAERGLRETMGEDPSPEVTLELIRCICARPDADRLQEARRLFAGLVARDASRPGLEVLLLLGETPGGLAPGEPLPSELQTWVSRQAPARAIHHLIALHPALDATPESANRLFQEAIDRFAATEPGVLGTWLVRHNRAEQALAMLEEPAKTRGDAFLSKIHALLRLGRDSEIDEALLSPPLAADGVEIEIVRAVIAGRRKDESAVKSAWTRALDQAAFDTRRNRFIEIARAADLQQAKEAAEDAWVAAIRSGTGPLPLFVDIGALLNSLTAQGRSEDLLAICRTMSRLEPGSVELQNNYIYLGLIHGIVTPADAIDRLTQIIQERPEFEGLESSLMLAEMMDDRPAEALARLPQLQASNRVAPGMKTALEGTVRILNGETETGTALLKDLDWNSFMPQEQRMFRNLLTRQSKAEVSLVPEEIEEIQVDPDQVPAWRKAVEKMEKGRAGDILPALPAPRMPSIDDAEPSEG